MRTIALDATTPPTTRVRITCQDATCAWSHEGSNDAASKFMNAHVKECPTHVRFRVTRAEEAKDG